MFRGLGFWVLPRGHDFVKDVNPSDPVLNQTLFIRKQRVVENIEEAVVVDSSRVGNHKDLGAKIPADVGFRVKNLGFGVQGLRFGMHDGVTTETTARRFLLIKGPDPQP